MPVPAVQNFDQGAVAGQTDQQKALLLKALAQGGSDMAAQVSQSGAVMGDMRQAAMQQAAGNVSTTAAAQDPNFGAQQAQAVAGQDSYFQNILAKQGESQQRLAGNLGEANTMYMEQVKAGIPLAHEQTQRELNSLSTAAQNAEAERAQRRALHEMQMQIEREQLAGAREARSSRAGDSGLDSRRLDLESRRLDLSEKELNAQLSGDGPRTEGQVNAARSQAFEEIMGGIHGGADSQAARALRTAIQISAGDPVAGEAALLALIGDGLDLNEDGKVGKDERITTPRGNKLSQDYLLGNLRRYYGA